MDEDIHQYSGEEIEVSYDVLRCTHARECVERLPEVFDPDERPWIDPDNADVDDLAGVIMECPTGALQFERSDGGPSEPVPEDNMDCVESLSEQRWTDEVMCPHCGSGDTI